jgi:NAD(P)-dependent dehydrogenase (short-subunit alcohol dehydrogenase family)
MDRPLEGVDRPLEGRVAIVTGAGSGLGRGSAIALATAGARVVLNDVDESGLSETASAVDAIGGSSLIVVGDVTRSGDVEALVAAAVASYGGLDIMHANAGVGRYIDLEVMPEADLDLVLAVDLKGVLLCAKYAIPALRVRGGGSIVMTSSVQASHSLRGCVVYAATKAGVIAAARTLAVEVGADNIRVNSISPGTIDTPMLDRDMADMDIEGAADFLQRVRSANTLGRVGTVAEVGAAVVFLASEAASYITASNLVVDGGFTAIKRF